MKLLMIVHAHPDGETSHPSPPWWKWAYHEITHAERL